MNEPIFIIYYITAGLGIGFLAGLVGVGGGGMAVPIFAFLFSLQGIADTEVVHLALGTSMASMIITTLGSMRAHYKKRECRLDYGRKNVERSSSRNILRHIRSIVSTRSLSGRLFQRIHVVCCL